jgi:hypothetical protein
MWIGGTSHRWCQTWHPYKQAHCAELEHGLKLHKCLDPYGERDLNPIHFICILEIKNIIRMNTNPWLNEKCRSFVEAPSAPLVFPVQVNNILESKEMIMGHLLTRICPFPPNFFVFIINLFHSVA